VLASDDRSAPLVRLTTRRFALSRSELVTTAVAAGVSAAGYLTAGSPYLARGVVGDLVGFAVLGTAARLAGWRLRHEAAVCLGLIGVVLAVDPQWPRRVADPVWWLAFGLGLGAYLAVRRHVCV
jgi:hypothetical protein